jgi:glyine---[glycyl-carrier protein] ligase
VHVTYRPITRADVEAGRGSVIGKPIPDLYIRLLDERGEPVPVGVPGEIWVGGAGVSNGYLNRPELTAQRFVTDPFDPSRAARLYRAGDLARRLPDGDLEFLGRIDAQVKIRGFRIELGEIEAALAACPEVADAAVIAREDIPGDKRLVAYVVAKNPSAFNPDDLRTALAASLPGHMIPAHFIALPVLPLNANGKLDRNALPLPDLAPVPHAQSMVLPSSQTEEAVAAIWRHVLGCTAVDCAEDFFRIGGHSLLATQVVSRIRDVFQIELPVALMFQHRTVQALAGHVDNQLRDKYRAEPMPPIEPRASDAPERLSVSQERMWLIHQLAPDNTAYNIPVVLELSGQLDIAAMEQAIDLLLQRHEALRTIYLLDVSHPVQIVQPWNKQPLEIADLSHLGEGALKEALTKAAAHASKTFDLSQDSMLRSVLFKLGDQRHLLVITAHHIAADDWSFGLLTTDLATAYNNLRVGQPAGLDPPALKYSDYAAWQRRWLETHNEQQLAYWRKQLSGVVPIELPTDKPRPKFFGFQGRINEQPFSDELHGRLMQFGRREGFTLFMTTLAAYAVLLHRLTGQTDFTIAVPIANRTHTTTEKLVGTFVNTLVIRVDMGGHPSFREVLRRIKNTALEAYAHQDAPFETLAAELGRNRDASRPPLAQVMFNLLNTPAHGMQFDGLNWQVHPLDLGAAQFEIGLSVDTTLSHTLKVEFNSELFEEGTIDRFVDQYIRVLDCMLTDLDVCIDDVPLLTAAERDQVLRGWNLTSSSYPSDTPFTRLFEDRVQQSPEAVAISLGSEALTYAELNVRTNRLAHVLIRHGAQRGAIVGLCMHRSLDLVVALLAIQKSGAAYLPLDPGFPAERLSYMLADSGASLLLSSLDAADGIEVPPQVKRIELDQLSADECPAENIPFASGPTDPAYVIYTSGSTGRPKGVVVQHGALVNFLHSMQRKPGLSNEDVLAAITTISFDIAGLELYLPLMVGARVELVPRETAADPALLAPLIEASGATVLQATPSTWRMLIEEGWTGSDRLRALCGGEALPSDLAEALLPRVKELWNLYGPTETTIWSSVEKIEAGDRVLTIGRPIANTQIYIVDKAGGPVSVGVAGEIWIGGDGVALGYHRRPELTAERFVPDRFGDRPNGRLYRTGDLGRWLADGRLEHLGRIDSQVKIRGFRIELGEIEAALNAHPMVRQSAVVTRETRPGDGRIVAYIVVNGGEDLTVSEVRRYLRASLPDYMIPSFVMTLQSLPLTANGKLDRGALPDVFRAIGDDAALSEPPAPGMEQRLADIWCETLQVEKVNAGDNFFDIGGHSLLAIRVATALQKRIGWRMDPRNLFFQSLRQIAAQADAATTRSAAAERIA